VQDKTVPANRQCYVTIQKALDISSTKYNSFFSFQCNLLSDKQNTCHEWGAWLFDHPVLSAAVIASYTCQNRRNETKRHRSRSDESAAGEFYFILIFSLHPTYEHISVRQAMRTKKLIFHSSQMITRVDFLSNINTYTYIHVCARARVKIDTCFYVPTGIFAHWTF
jgi:hypothetical protein